MAWTKQPPNVAGYYEVRMDPEAWGLSEGTGKPGRIVYVDPETGRFDAVTFGGPIRQRCWRWRGPIEVPAAVPDSAL